MVKKFLTVFMLLINLVIFDAFAQEKQYNEQYSPASVVKRLSYENFKNIKLLRTAILNYGGGEQEVQKLVEQYADATALYFQDRTDDAASKFSENEKEIFRLAKKLSELYHKDTSAFLNKAIKRNVQINLENEINCQGRNPVIDKYLDQAKAALKKASTIYEDYKYSSDKTQGSAIRLITAIYYYRTAKQNLFMMYQAYVDSLTLDKDKKRDRELKDEMLDKLLREDFRGDYKKDQQDSKNKAFISVEKKV